MQLFKSLLTLLLITTLAWAPGFINGLVFNHLTGDPVADVDIFCFGDTREGPKVIHATTNGEGRYRLPFILQHHGPVFLVFKLGYRRLFYEYPEPVLLAGDRVNFPMRKITINKKDLVWQQLHNEINSGFGLWITQPKTSLI